MDQNRLDQDQQNFENLGPIRTDRSPDLVVRASLIEEEEDFFLHPKSRFSTFNEKIKTNNLLIAGGALLVISVLLYRKYNL